MEKRLLKDFKEKVIEASGLQIEDEVWSPVLSGDSGDDDNSRFIIDGKSVQGIKTEKSEQTIDFIKNVFNKRYK